MKKAGKKRSRAAEADLLRKKLNTIIANINQVQAEIAANSSADKGDLLAKRLDDLNAKQARTEVRLVEVEKGALNPATPRPTGTRTRRPGLRL